MTRKLTTLELGQAEVEFSRSAYFPTLVYAGKMSDAKEFNKDLLAAIYDERANDEDGIQRSNFKELGGWHSKNMLHKKPAFAPLVRRVESMLAEISSNLGYDPKYELKITTMWAITNPPGSSNRAHVHPGALWSGVYYVHAPENAGKIEFTDPRTIQIMNSAKFLPKTRRKSECWTKVKVVPTPGKALFFPSWLYHSVEPNLAEGTGRAAERVIISYNINQVKKKN